MRYLEIPSALIFKVSGKDSPRYLNARLTNDIKTLAVGAGCLAAMLTPQGRTQGLFNVLRTADTEFILTADGGDIENVEAALKKFIVADRVEVERLGEELHLYHLLDIEESAANLSALGLPIPPSGMYAPIKKEESVLYRNRRSRLVGIDLVLDAHASATLIGDFKRLNVTKLSSEEAEKVRLRAGIPSFPKEINEDRLFSESGLMSAVSFKKGCYVGQEVVEKIDAYGKVPKLLKAISIEGEGVSPEAEVLSAAVGSEPRSIGKVISTAFDPEANLTYSFAVLKNEPELEKLSLTVEGRPAKITPITSS